MLKYFSSGRTIDQNPMQVLPPIHTERVRCKTGSNISTVAQYQGIIDRAYASKGWAVLAFHDIVTTTVVSTDVSTSTFQSVVSYLASKGIPVATYGEVMRRGTV